MTSPLQVTIEDVKPKNIPPNTFVHQFLKGGYALVNLTPVRIDGISPPERLAFLRKVLAEIEATRSMHPDRRSFTVPFDMRIIPRPVPQVEPIPTVGPRVEPHADARPAEPARPAPKAEAQGPTEEQKKAFDAQVDGALRSINGSIDQAIQRAVTALGNDAKGLTGVRVTIDLNRTALPPTAKYTPSVRIELDGAAGSKAVYQVIIKEIKKVNLFALTLPVRDLPKELFTAQLVREHVFTPKLEIKAEKSAGGVQVGLPRRSESLTRPKFEPVALEGSSGSVETNKDGEVVIKAGSGRAGPKDPVRWRSPRLPGEIIQRPKAGVDYTIRPTLNVGGNSYTQSVNYALSGYDIKLTYSFVLTANQVTDDNLQTTRQDMQDLLLIMLTHYVSAKEIEISREDLLRVVRGDIMHDFDATVRKIKAKEAK